MVENATWRKARLTLHKVLENTSPPGTSASQLFGSSFVWDRGLHVTFDRDDVQNIAGAASTIREIRKFQRNLTFKEVHKDVQDLVVECFRKKRSYRKRFLRNRMDALWSEYDSGVKVWDFHIPIANMEMDPRRVQTVGKVKFKVRGEADVRRHQEIVDENTAKAEAKGKPHQAWYLKKWHEDLRAHQGMVHAHVSVKGTQAMAKRRALAETRRAIAALKAISAPDDDHFGRYCWMLGEGQSSEYRHIFGEYFPRKLWVFPERTLMSWKLKLDAERREFMKHSRFTTLSRIVGNGNRNGFEQSIDVGAQWLGNAMNIPVAIGRREDYENAERERLDRLENHLLVERLGKLMVALEVMLNPDNNGAKKTTIARRTALTVAISGREDDVYEMVKKAYEARNESMHKGDLVLIKSEIDQVAIAVYHVLIYLLRRVRNFRTKQDWANRLKSLDHGARATNPHWFDTK